MTYELGRATFILDSDGDTLLRETAKTYNEVTKQAQQLTKNLAKEEAVRQSDVKKAASVLLTEEKRLAAEQLKIAKEVARQQALIERQAEQARKARARAIISEEKAIERERIDSLKRQAREEAIIRSRNAQLRREEEVRARREQAASGRGIGAGFVRGLPGDLATIAGFGAIASGAILVREAITTLIDATTKQEAAQRGLNAAFKDTQILFKENSEALGQAFNRVNSEVQEATARFGVLNKQTALTGEQIRNLSKVA